LCNSCASLAGLVLSFIACFILLVIAPLRVVIVVADGSCTRQMTSNADLDLDLDLSKVNRDIRQSYSYSYRVTVFNNVLRGIMQSEKMGFQLRAELSATVVHAVNGGQVEVHSRRQEPR